MMTKEQKIDMLLAFLAPIIFEGKDENAETAPQITFLSANEVQIGGFAGEQLPVNKVYPDNPLKEYLEKIVNYNHADERKNWEECCVEEEDIEELEEEGIDLENDYIPTLCPDHIYHTINKLGDLIETVTKPSEDSPEIDYSGYLEDNRFLEFIRHEYDLKECSPTAVEIAASAFGCMDNAIHEFNKWNK